MLTEQLREDYCPEFISMYWGEIAMGRDPRVTLRDLDPRTGRRREGRPSQKQMVEQVPTLEQSAAAMTRIELRRDGQPAQQINLEQDLRARVVTTSATLDVEQLQRMEPMRRHAIREMLRNLVKPTMADEALPEGEDDAQESLESSSDDQAVIDTTAIEK
jgi:hypothetical protein